VSITGDYTRDEGGGPGSAPIEKAPPEVGHESCYPTRLVAVVFKLVAYGSLYLAQHMNELHQLDELDLVLVVPAMNKALLAELAFLQCERRSLDPGYAALVGLGYTTYMVVTDEVAETERDEFLKIFSHHPVHDPDAVDWLQDWLALQEEHMPQVKRSKSFHEVRQKLLSSMTPKERLSGLSAEEIRAYLESLSRGK
jgi:hypothetical protein